MYVPSASKPMRVKSNTLEFGGLAGKMTVKIDRALEI